MINTSGSFVIGGEITSTFNLKLLLSCRIKSKQAVPGMCRLMNARVWSYFMHNNAAYELLYTSFLFFSSLMFNSIPYISSQALFTRFLISEVLSVLQRSGILQFSLLIKLKAGHCWKEQQGRKTGSRDQNVAAGRQMKTAQRNGWLKVLVNRRRKWSSDNPLKVSS